MDNPFYKGDDEDDEEYNRRSAVHLSTLSTAHGERIQPSGGTAGKSKGKKGRESVTADCFKPETIGVHVNKGGDGFEAWKGNRKVIKKRQIGVQKVEQKVVPREGQYVQPWNFQTGFSKWLFTKQDEVNSKVSVRILTIFIWCKQRLTNIVDYLII